MADETLRGEKTLRQHEDHDYAVLLPCSPASFGDFISGLLGKPQTISGHVQGFFEINRADIASIFNLLDQRISQQNEAHLVQFSILIEYSDSTTVLINSIDDFYNYAEVRPRESIGFQLFWTYLIKFIDRNVPEKQTIEISFRDSRKRYRPLEPVGQRFEESYVGFYYKIQHTARTWGVDLASLIEGHLRTQKKAKISDRLLWISNNKGWIIFCTALVLFLVANAGLFHAIKSYERLQLSTFNEHIINMANNNKVVDIVTYIAKQGLSGSVAIYMVSVILYMVVMALIIGVFCLIFASILDYEARGALLLTTQSEEAYEGRQDAISRSWLSATLSLIGALIVGIVSNFVFLWLTTNWV